MSNFFNMDSPIMRFLGRLADVMILNIVFLITCLPVVTIGAAWTSLSYVTLKMSRDEESYIVKSYFKAFRQNFRQATAIWGIALVAMFIFYMDFHIIRSMNPSMAQAMFILLAAIAMLAALTLLYVFPVLAKFDNTILNTIKKCLFYGNRQSSTYPADGCSHRWLCCTDFPVTADYCRWDVGMDYGWICTDRFSECSHSGESI